jgi:hypothetical protein
MWEVFRRDDPATHRLPYFASLQLILFEGVRPQARRLNWTQIRASVPLGPAGSERARDLDDLHRKIAAGDFRDDLVIISEQSPYHSRFAPVSERRLISRN